MKQEKTQCRRLEELRGKRKKEVVMSTKRLLSIPEFQEYAGGIGRNTALRLARDAEVRVKIGARLLINVDKFDLWVEENSK